MCATFNGDPRITIVACYSLINASNKTDIDTFYNMLSSLAWHIPKHNILIINEDINVHISKFGNNKFYLHNLLNRNGEYLVGF